MDGNGEESNVDKAGPSNESETFSENHNKPNSMDSTERQGGWNFLNIASPPNCLSLDEIFQAADGIKNMALAHEIAVDENFKLQRLEPENDTLHKTVNDIMHRAFWNLLREQLNEDPPNYTQALVLLSEIRDSFEVLVGPNHPKIQENVREVLDIDLIKQQAEKGVLDFHHYSHYILNVMSKICAPVRDDRIRELLQYTDVVETFKEILEMIKLMRLDMANFTIMMMRPKIAASSIEYEKAKFAEILKVEPYGLQYTRQWLLKHLDENKINAASVDINDIKQVTQYILTEAYLDVLNWDWSPQAETLMLDRARFVESRDKINQFSIMGSIILMCSNTVGAPVQGVAKFKKNIKQHLHILLNDVDSNKMLEEVIHNIVLQVIKDVKTTLQDVSAPDLPENIEQLLEGQIVNLVSEDNKMRSLVKMRIRQYLQKILMSQNATSTQVPPGLSFLQEELPNLAARFLMIVTHNRSVFAEYYQEIVATEISRRKSTLGSLLNENGVMNV